MFPKKYRLPAKLIKKVLDKGKWIHGKELSLVMLKQEKPACSRMAIVIPAKIDKRAVIRNRLKRRLREEARKNLFKLISGQDIIIFGNKKALKLEFKQLREKLTKLFKENNLIKNLDSEQKKKAIN